MLSSSCVHAAAPTPSVTVGDPHKLLPGDDNADGLGTCWSASATCLRRRRRFGDFLPAAGAAPEPPAPAPVPVPAPAPALLGDFFPPELDLRRAFRLLVRGVFVDDPAQLGDADA